MDLDVYVLGQDGTAGRRRGLIIHVAPAGKVVGRCMVPPIVLCVRVTGAPEDWEKTIRVGPHYEGLQDVPGSFNLKSRWVLDLPHGARVSWGSMPLVNRLPAMKALAALGGKVDG